MSKHRIRAAALILSSGLVLSGCAASPTLRATAQGETSQAADTRPVALTTFTVLADIARNVAGEHIRVESITKVGAEIHGYEPTPGDIVRASEADLILDNGLGLEAWFARFVADIDVPHAVVTSDVDPLLIAGDADAGKPNPHAWMSPRVVQQ